MIIIYTVLWIISGFFISIFIYIFYKKISYFISHKLVLLSIGFQLIKNKDKSIKSIGWKTIRLFFWES